MWEMEVAWSGVNWIKLICAAGHIASAVNQRTVCVFVCFRLSNWLTDSLTDCLSTSRSLSVRNSAPFLCLSVYRVPSVYLSFLPAHHRTHTTPSYLVGLVRHDRQKCVPAKVSYVNVKNLKPQWNKGEVDQLEGWPHQAVCAIWENRELRNDSR